MPLRVNYKNRIGYYTETQQYKDMPARSFKVWFCHANALCAMIHFFKNEKNEREAQLAGFFADIKHAKRCIEDGYFNQWSKCHNFHFFAKEMDADLWKLVKLMTKHGIKITIE